MIKILILGTIWGVNWVFMKIGGEYYPPAFYSSLRYLLGGAILYGICIPKKRAGAPVNGWGWILFTAATQTAYTNLVLQYSLQYTQAGVTSIVFYTMPIWLTLLAHFMIPGDKLDLKKIQGLFLGIAGLFFVLGINPFSFQMNNSDLYYHALVLTGAISWAFSIIIVKKILHLYDGLQFNAYQMLAAGAYLAIYSLIFENLNFVRWEIPGIISLLFSGGIASALAFILWFDILSTSDASKSSISLLITPAVGVLSGWLFLNEKIGWWVIAGLALVLSGVWIVNKREAEESGKQPR